MLSFNQYIDKFNFIKKDILNNKYDVHTLRLCYNQLDNNNINLLEFLSNKKHNEYNKNLSIKVPINNIHYLHKCEYCELFFNIFKYNDTKINNQFNNYIIIKQKNDGVFIDKKETYIISDILSNYIYINTILENNNIDVSPIYMWFTCFTQSFIVKKYIDSSWLNVSIDMFDFTKLLKSLLPYKFCNFNLNKNLFRIDNNNKIYLNDLNESSLTYNNIRFYHLSKYQSYIPKLYKITHNNITNTIKLNDDKNYLSLYYHCITGNEQYYYIIQSYLYILYYMYNNKSNYNNIIWIDSDSYNATIDFNKLNDCNILTLYKLICKYNLRINILDIFNKKNIL